MKNSIIPHPETIPDLLATGNEPILIGHRGYSANFPENTLLAFRKALEAGIFFLECDVQLSQDGIPVLIHDFSLLRTTGLDQKVAQTSWSEMNKLDAGRWKSEEFSGEPIPSLSSLLALMPQHVFINLELKCDGSQSDCRSLARAVMPLVSDYQWHERILYSSFRKACLAEVRRLDAQAHIGILQHSWLNVFPKRSIQNIRPITYHCEYHQFNSKVKAQTEKAGLPVLVYTVNDNVLASRLFHQGVRGFFTDNPHLKIVRGT